MDPEKAWILTLDAEYTEPTMVRPYEPERNEFFVQNRTDKDVLITIKGRLHQKIKLSPHCTFCHTPGIVPTGEIWVEPVKKAGNTLPV